MRLMSRLPCDNSSSATPLEKTVFSRMRSLVRMLSLVFAVTATACGGDDDRPPTTPPPTTPPPTQPPPSGGGITVTGSERIGWTQNTQGSQSIQQFRFVAYIDNRSRASLTSVQCIGTANVFNCSAPLPPLSQGRHSLQLASFDPSGTESGPSDELILNVVSRVSASSTPIPGLLRRTCIDSAGESACYAVDVVVQGLDQPSNLLTTDDGRLLFIDRQAEVFLVDRGALVRSSLVSPDSGSTIESIALATDFTSSRHVYAAIAASRDDRRTLSIVRFREAGGTLAEAAVIVPDLPIANAGAAALSVGGGNDLYVALPAEDATGVNAATTGVILRFDSQGAAKGQTRLASPLLAESNPRPAKLAWQDGRLWLASRETARSPALGQLSPGDDAAPDQWPLRAEPVPVIGFPEAGWGVRDLAPAESASRNERSGLFFVLEDPRALYRAVSDDMGTLTPARVALGSILPEAVATAPTGDVYVAAMLNSGRSDGVILRMTPLTARRAAPR